MSFQRSLHPDPAPRMAGKPSKTEKVESACASPHAHHYCSHKAGASENPDVHAVSRPEFPRCLLYSLEYHWRKRAASFPAEIQEGMMRTAARSSESGASRTACKAVYCTAVVGHFVVEVLTVGQV